MSKFTLEIAMNKDFNLSSQVGFSTSNLGKGNIATNRDAMSQLAINGKLLAVPASITLDELKGAVGFVKGTKRPDHDGCVYHIIPCFLRVREELPKGVRRSGTKGVDIPGFGEVAPAGSIVS